MRRPFSLSQLRFFSVSRLSCSFLPRATASSTFARPRSLKQIFSGTMVMPPRAAGLVVEAVGLQIFRDVGVVEPERAATLAGVGSADAAPPLAERFYLG